MRGMRKTRMTRALLACGGGLAIVAAMPADATGSYSPYNETPSAALARYVRELTHNPKDFQSLIGAGRAALELGDTQAAAGFFARADEINPGSPFPQAGMGAVQVANGEAQAAMPYFTRAQQLGATQAMLGCDRGLAYDMLGKQALAQADYRAALAGADRDEASRRLALSLAISGDKAGALAAITPLSAKGDATSARVRAFVLALTGDTNAAMAAIDAAMPGSWSRVAPFVQRLPTLAAGQKAAAVNLGIFPDPGGAAFAYSAPVAPAPQIASRASTLGVAATVSGDRLAGVDALLQTSATEEPQSQQQVAEQPAYQAKPVQVSYSAPVRSAPAPKADAAATGSKIWLQLASGQNRMALSRQFARLKLENRDVLEGITGYVAQSEDRARLVIGPFRGPSDAQTLAEDLRSLGVAAFRWTNSDSDRIVPLATQ